MIWFPDGATCRYFPVKDHSVVRAIGWLEAGRDFPKGIVDEKLYNRLSELFKDPWQPVASAGLHGCTLCVIHPEKHGRYNLFVPGECFLYVCPELILHYMNAHAYLPPEEFCKAVMRCPDTRSIEYKKMFLANGGRQFKSI